MEGWYKGILIDKKETGLFPASFFRVKPSEDGKDSVMRELHNVFREWGDLLKKLYQVCHCGPGYQSEQCLADSLGRPAS